jgi:exodeoxyribonuclease VII small subunit
MNRKSNPATTSETSDSGSEPAFEQLLEELEAIVGRMEEGNLPLEETLREFERGQKLAAACETRLRDATQRVQKLLEDTPGGEDASRQ